MVVCSMNHNAVTWGCACHARVLTGPRSPALSCPLVRLSFESGECDCSSSCSGTGGDFGSDRFGSGVLAGGCKRRPRGMAREQVRLLYVRKGGGFESSAPTRSPSLARHPRPHHVASKPWRVSGRSSMGGRAMRLSGSYAPLASSEVQPCESRYRELPTLTQRCADCGNWLSNFEGMMVVVDDHAHGPICNGCMDKR